MRVFNATQEFIALVLAEAKIEKSDRLFQLLRDTRESHLLFREEIGEFIEELNEKGFALTHDLSDEWTATSRQTGRRSGPRRNYRVVQR